MSQGTIVLIQASELEDLIRRAVEAVVKDHMNTEEPELLSTAKLAKILGVSDDLVRYWVRADDCPHVPVGKKKLKFRLAEVTAWLKERGRA
jgi:excisionase family DNA binding protein